MRQSYPLYLILFAIFFTAWQCPANAASFPEPPDINDYVVDKAGIIDPGTVEEINTTAILTFGEEAVPIYVVTIPSMISYDFSGSIERYARLLFDEWGIGYQERNYGVLLLVSKGDRKARIELGAAWNNQYNDQTDYIMHQLIIPKFKQGQYSQGILEGVNGLDSMIRGLNLPKPTRPWWFFPAIIACVIFIGLLIRCLIKNGRNGWCWAFLVIVGLILLFLLKSSMRGGGGGLGGGSGGGGGSTGSW